MSAIIDNDLNISIMTQVPGNLFHDQIIVILIVLQWLRSCWSVHEQGNAAESYCTNSPQGIIYVF